MKKFIITISILVTATLLFFACKKNSITVAPFEVASDKALFKLNYASPYTKMGAVQIKIDDIRVSSTITYGTPYPGGGLNTGGSSNADYMSLSPGEHTVSLSVPKAGSSEDSVQVYTTSINVEAKTYYTLHVTDTLASTYSILLKDPGNKPDSGFSKFSFVNLIPGSAIDLYFGTTMVASNIGYKNSTDTFTLASNLSRQFAIRLAGAAPNSPPLAIYPTTSGLVYNIPNQRVYTAFARGYLGLVSPDTRRPQLSFIFNK